MCERFLAINWEHVGSYPELRDELSSAARNRIMTGMSQALQKLKKKHAVYTQEPVEYPSLADFMSWRPPHG